QVTHGDVGLAVTLESRNEAGHTIDEPNSSLLDQHHHAGRRGNDFGQRSEVEDRVERHRLAGRHQRSIADRFLVDDAVADADQHHGTRQTFLLDVAPYQRLDSFQHGWYRRG